LCNLDSIHCVDYSGWKLRPKCYQTVTELVKSNSAPAPLPDLVEQMKAKLVDSMLPGNWIYEIKFDGYRALVRRSGSETSVLSRNKKNWGGKFTVARTHQPKLRFICF
jgi:ATP-dependent DNA ligase